MRLGSRGPVGSLVLLCVGGLACDSSTTEQAPPPPAVPPALAAATARLLDDYDAVREMLAQGETDRLRPASLAVERSAREAHARAPVALQPDLDALATAASRLAEAPAGDLAEARRGFGELSRHVVTILATEPALAGDLRVHACDGAVGYPKWVERGDPESSPYAEARSADCPRPSDWRP